MERIPNGRYTKEFREEAVRMVTDGGLSALEISKRLSLPKSTLERWIRVSKTGALGEIGRGQRHLTDIERELAKVKRELSLAKMERDILKKARGLHNSDFPPDHSSMISLGRFPTRKPHRVFRVSDS